MNLQPDDGFFAISGKVLVRAIYCPLTLGMSELILQTEREASFSSYAIDLQKEKYDKEVLPRIKYRFDSFLGEDMNYAVLHMGKPADTKKADDRQILIWKIDTIHDATFYSSSYKQRKSLPLFRKRPMTLCQNDSENNFQHNCKYYVFAGERGDEQVRLIFDRMGTCIKWEVLKKDPAIYVTPNGLVEFY